ncbi:transcriptional regulator [Enemella evansiae]|uniref:Transcriptional regulator n=1 Tax=Enemella evansiae TaxID=2016499 RepID=A0A255GAG0_9ACTN|nr:transcriptional regulator [Enemella evansiae]OYO19721.1 transcriptional regulator [Enemella evansiae]
MSASPRVPKPSSPVSARSGSPPVRSRTARTGDPLEPRALPGVYSIWNIQPGGLVQLNPLAIAALAIFAEQPRHPYDVYATMRARREEQTVKLSAGTLYHTINRLAEAGLLAELGTESAGNRPERTVYRITAEGRHRLDERIRELLREPVQEYPQFPVAVGEMHNLPADEAAMMLQERTVALDSRLETMDLVAGLLDERALPRRFWLDLDLIRHSTGAERDWCARTAAAIAAGEIDWTTLPTRTAAKDNA